MVGLKTYEGSCHCGAVRFEVDADLSSEPIVECDCSMCTKKALLHLIVEKERFRLLEGEGSLTLYQFGTMTARHTFCKVCGIHPFYVPRSHPDRVDVNARCLDGVDLGALIYEPFDGKNWEESIDGLREKV